VRQRVSDRRAGDGAAISAVLVLGMAVVMAVMLRRVDAGAESEERLGTGFTELADGAVAIETGLGRASAAIGNA
jgi:hypothetical protein